MNELYKGDGKEMERRDRRGSWNSKEKDFKREKLVNSGMLERVQEGQIAGLGN